VFGKKTFEILALKDGRWMIDGVADHQEIAQAEATKLLGRAGIEGVRVIKESKVPLHLLQEKDILFEKLKPKGEDKIFVQNIDDAPLCDSFEDLFVGEARLTINRLFRAYLDKNNLTATEVLHAPRELKRLLDEGSLLFAAVGKVATFQVKKIPGATVNERRDALFDFINQIQQKAEANARQKWPRIRSDGFNEVMAYHQEKNPQDVGYLARFAMTTELVENRNYMGKLGQVMEWATQTDEPWVMAAIDAFVSDILQNAEVLRDLMGNHRELGTALVTLICLAEGETLGEDMPEDVTPEHPEFTKATLHRLVAEGKLPESRAALIDRVRRQVEGLNPLSRGDREEEREVFVGLLDKLIPDTRILGGPAMAQAVTARQSTIINKGGNKGMREAAETMLPALGDPERKAGYLLSLMESEIGQNALHDDLNSLLSRELVGQKSVNHLVRDKLPPNKKMAKVTAIYNHVKDSSLPGERKQEITDKLDDLLASYIVDGKILDKLNNPDKPLHVRALMLVSMVQPEMLPRGKASDLARGIIVKHLRRPTFEEDLVAEIPDPSEKAKTLRRFHQQLHRCGFFG
jgi:hypothetical protein